MIHWRSIRLGHDSYVIQLHNWSYYYLYGAVVDQVFEFNFAEAKISLALRPYQEASASRKRDSRYLSSISGEGSESKFMRLSKKLWELRII